MVTFHDICNRKRGKTGRTTPAVAPTLLLMISALLLISSCGGNLNGMGGLPGYLGYIRDSRHVEEISMEPNRENSVLLKWVQPDGTMADASTIFPDGSTPGYLVLTFQEDSLDVHRSLIFDEDLNLIIDTRDYDGELGGSFESWIRGPGSWGWRIRGELDLGRYGWLPSEPDGENSPFIPSGRSGDRQRIVPVYDGVWAEYLVELEPPDSTRPELVLSIRGSRDVDGNAAEYDGYDPFAVPPPDDKPLILMSDFPQGITDALEDAGLFDFVSSSLYDVRFREFIPEPAKDRIIAVLSLRGDGEGSFHMLFYLPYEDLVDVSDASLTDYEFHIIPGTWGFGEYDPQFMYREGYFAVLNNPGGYGRDYDSRDMMLDFYKIDGPGIMPSLGSPRLDFIRRIPYWNLFQDEVPGRDIAVTYRNPSGDWFVYNREASMLYRLSIAAGGIE